MIAKTTNVEILALMRADQVKKIYNVIIISNTLIWTLSKKLNSHISNIKKLRIS